MQKFELPRAGLPTISRNQISRQQFLRGTAGLGGAAALAALLSACGAQNDSQVLNVDSVDDLEVVGGDLGVATFDGLQGDQEIQAWLKEHGVVLNFQAINSQQEVTAKLKGAGVNTLDVVEYSPLEGDSYTDLGIPLFLEDSWFSNIDTVRSEFLDLYRQPDGTLSAIPFMFGASPCNYRPDKVDPIKSWFDLLDPEFNGRITLIDDALSNVSTAALALGHEDTSRLTVQELRDVGDFLRALVGQARSIAPSYGDMQALLVSGDVYATFSGWSAMPVFAAETGIELGSAYPQEKVMGTVDSWLIPATAQNKRTAVAYIDEFLTPEMQLYVTLGLGGGPIVKDSASLLAGEEDLVFNPDKLDDLISNDLVFLEAAPLNAADGYVSRQDWLNLWEAVKA